MKNTLKTKVKTHRKQLRQDDVAWFDGTGYIRYERTRCPMLLYHKHFYLGYAYDREERNIEARRCQTPFWWKRQIECLGWTDLVLGFTSRLIFDTQGAWCEETKRSWNGIGIRVMSLQNLWCHDLPWDIELLCTSKNLGKAVKRCWRFRVVRWKLNLERSISFCGCRSQLLHLVTLH